MGILKEYGLKDGGLINVRSEHMIERYNKALQFLTGKTIDLKEINIDALGYSPEVAEILGEDYLDLNQSNQKVIILTMAQKELPVLNNSFSSTRAMFKEFMTDNKITLTNLTARDVVVGEIENDTIKINKIDDILHIRHIKFFVDTPKGLVETSEELKKQIANIHKDENNYFNDEKLQAICDMSSEVGNVLKVDNSIIDKEYITENFYTDHFNGLYVFNCSKFSKPLIIFKDKKVLDENCVDKENEYSCLDGNNCKEVLNSLINNEMLINDVSDSLMYNDNLLTVLELKRDLMSLISYSMSNPDSEINANKIKEFIYNNYDDLPKEYKIISEIIKYIKHDKGMEKISEFISRKENQIILPYILKVNTNYIQEHYKSNHTYMCKLISRIIAEYTEYDPVTTYIVYKEKFFELFSSYPKNLQEHIAKLINKVYIQNKQDFREIMLCYKY